MAARYLLAAALLAITTTVALTTVPSPTVLPSSWLVPASISNAVPSPAGGLIAVQFTSPVDPYRAGTTLSLMSSANGSTVGTVSFSSALLSFNWVTDAMIAVVTNQGIQAISVTALSTPLWSLVAPPSNVTYGIISSTLVNSSLLYFVYGNSTSNVIDLYTGKILWSKRLASTMNGPTLLCTKALWCGHFDSGTSTFYVFDALNSSTLATVRIPVSRMASVVVTLGADGDCVAVDCAVSFASATSVSIVTLQQLPTAWKARVARTFTFAAALPYLYAAVRPIPPFSTKVNLPWLVAIAFDRNVTVYNVADGSVVGVIVTSPDNQMSNTVFGMVAVPKSTSATTLALLFSPFHTKNVTAFSGPSAITAVISLNLASGNMTVTSAWDTGVNSWTWCVTPQTLVLNSTVYVALTGSTGTSSIVLIDLHTGSTAYRASLPAEETGNAALPFVAGDNLVIQTGVAIASFTLAVTSTVISSQPAMTQSMVYSTSESTAVALQSTATNTFITCIKGSNTASPSLSSTSTIPLATATGVMAGSFYALSPNSDGSATAVYVFDVSTSIPAQMFAVTIPLVSSPAARLMGTATADGLTVLAWNETGRTLYVLSKGQLAKNITFNSNITAVAADETQLYVVTETDVVAYSVSTLKARWTAAGYGGAGATMELGPDFNHTQTLAHYSTVPDLFVVRDRATGRALFTWDGPGCVGPIRHFRGDYFITVNNFRPTPGIPQQYLYLFRLNLTAPESSGYYGIFVDPQAPTVVFSPQGIVAVCGSGYLVVLNLFNGETMWVHGLPGSSDSGSSGYASLFQSIKLSADGNNLLLFTSTTSLSFFLTDIDVSVINLFTGITTLRLPGTSWNSMESAVGPGGCNSFIFSSMESGSIVQYGCLPIPAVSVPENWNPKDPLLGPTNPFTFPPVTAPPRIKSDDTSDLVVLIALVVAFALVGGAIGFFFLLRRIRRARQGHGYGAILDEGSTSTNGV